MNIKAFLKKLFCKDVDTTITTVAELEKQEIAVRDKERREAQAELERSHRDFLRCHSETTRNLARLTKQLKKAQHG